MFQNCLLGIHTLTLCSHLPLSLSLSVSLTHTHGLSYLRYPCFSTWLFVSFANLSEMLSWRISCIDAQFKKPFLGSRLLIDDKILSMRAKQCQILSICYRLLLGPDFVQALPQLGIWLRGARRRTHLSPVGSNLISCNLVKLFVITKTELQ